ncbi:MAG TPA: AMP-binding protein [Solirubrobacteraceae bacterium]|jgi:O-succinylbenzoic acid--CoA ligase
MQVEAWLHRASRSTPGLTAVQTPQERLTYGELWSAARAGASELQARGARKGERVGIVLPPGIAFAQALHACFLLGAVAVPVDLRLTAPERRHVGAGCRVLVEEPLARGPSGEGLRVGGGDGVWEINARTHDLGEVCAVIHTSGTTSAPRPVELTYGNFLWSALGSGVALGVDPAERWLCPALPVSHVGGLSILVRSCIYATTAVVHERFDTQLALASLMEEEVTLVSLVSTTLSRLLDAGLSNPPRLRYALTGGGPVPDVLIHRARAAGVPVAPTYGLTEACSQVTTNGPSLFCTKVKISSDGEIFVAGPTVAPVSLGEDGFLHTGDLGHLDTHGHLHVSGRASDTIVSGGENVSPSEVEGVLESHPAVSEAAVVGRPDEQWGEAVVAIVLPSTTLDEDDLRAHCASLLAPFKVPKRVEFVSAPLPRTRSGKLLRREL